MKIDSFDKSILRLLQQNNRLTADDLAEKVGLSSSAVQRRLKRLRSEKIIEADISIISPTVAGIEVTCIVDVSLERGTSQALEKFKSSMLKCKEVAQCYYVTGSADFILVGSAAKELEGQLVSNPYDVGESRDRGTRVGFVKPLAVQYEVIDDVATVIVFGVWRTDRRG